MVRENLTTKLWLWSFSEFVFRVDNITVCVRFIEWSIVVFKLFRCTLSIDRTKITLELQTVEEVPLTIITIKWENTAMEIPVHYRELVRYWKYKFLFTCNSYPCIFRLGPFVGSLVCSHLSGPSYRSVNFLLFSYRWKNPAN